MSATFAMSHRLHVYVVIEAVMDDLANGFGRRAMSIYPVKSPPFARMRVFKMVTVTV